MFSRLPESIYNYWLVGRRIKNSIIQDFVSEVERNSKKSNIMEVKNFSKRILSNIRTYCYRKMFQSSIFQDFVREVEKNPKKSIILEVKNFSERILSNIHLYYYDNMFPRLPESISNHWFVERCVKSSIFQDFVPEVKQNSKKSDISKIKNISKRILSNIRLYYYRNMFPRLLESISHHCLVGRCIQIFIFQDFVQEVE